MSDLNIDYIMMQTQASRDPVQLTHLFFDAKDTTEVLNASLTQVSYEWSSILSLFFVIKSCNDVII